MTTRVAPILRNSSSDKWYTPRALLAELGTFDLDPANDDPKNHPTALRHFGEEEDGLAQDWGGARVWLNPPFSNARPWIEKMIAHGDGIVLVFCRSDAVWFHKAVCAATAVLMLKGRVEFTRPDGSRSRCPLGCVLLAFGRGNADVLKCSNLEGVFLKAVQRG